MESEGKPSQYSLRSRLLSNESLSISESEYSVLLSNLSPRHKTNENVKISIEFHSKYKGKHIIYRVFGSDPNGEYESQRRYNDFLTLRVILVSQWPGCYIPKLPPKKRIVNAT
jgi:hypothetical protein